MTLASPFILCGMQSHGFMTTSDLAVTKKRYDMDCTWRPTQFSSLEDTKGDEEVSQSVELTLFALLIWNLTPNSLSVRVKLGRLLWDSCYRHPHALWIRLRSTLNALFWSGDGSPFLPTVAIILPVMEVLLPWRRVRAFQGFPHDKGSCSSRTDRAFSILNRLWDRWCSSTSDLCHSSNNQMTWHSWTALP